MEGDVREARRGDDGVSKLTNGGVVNEGVEGRNKK